MTGPSVDRRLALGDPVRQLPDLDVDVALRGLRDEIASTPRIVVDGELLDYLAAPARRRRGVTVSIAAGLVVIGALGFVAGRSGRTEVGDTQTSSGAGSVPAAVATDPSGTFDAPHSVVAPEAVGLFPAGDVRSVVEAGYDSPEAVVRAYLEDRTDPSLVPFGTAVEATVDEMREIDDGRALVLFGLETESDGSDGHAEVVRVTAPDGATGWVVTQAFVVSLEIPAMEFRNGELVGSISGSSYSTNLYIRDAVTGESLRETRHPLMPPNSTERPPGVPVDVADLTVSTVGVLVWQTGFDPGVAAPVFGEFRISDDESVVTGSRVISTAFYPDFAVFEDPTVSALDALDDGETVEIMDEHGITITASHDVAGSTYCIAVASPGENARNCWPLASIAAGDARGYVANVIYRVVPDSVTVTRRDEVVPVDNNVWYGFVADDGSVPRHDFSDGQVTQTEN